MKRNKIWSISLAILTTFVVIFYGGFTSENNILAQSQSPTTEEVSNPLKLSESTYQDPAQRFQIGILEGYKVTNSNNATIFESGDGNLA